jgi:hypothetical protein
MKKKITTCLVFSLFFGFSSLSFAQSNTKEISKETPNFSTKNQTPRTKSTQNKADFVREKESTAVKQEHIVVSENNNQQYVYNANQNFLMGNNLLKLELAELKSSFDKMNTPMIDKTTYLKAKSEYDKALENYENALRKLLSDNRISENIRIAANNEINY